MAGVKRTLISHYLEAAPADTFSPDGEKCYRVVAMDPHTGVVVKLTDVQQTPELALADYESTLKDGTPDIMGDPDRAVTAIEFATVLTMIGREVDTVIGALRRELSGLREQVVELERSHRAVLLDIIKSATNPANPKAAIINEPLSTAITRKANEQIVKISPDVEIFVHTVERSAQDACDAVTGGAVELIPVG